MNKRRLLTSGVAVAAAAAVLFGGTFAWQSISQTALNEVSRSINPGGRLHDDFNDITAELKAAAAADENGEEKAITMTFDKDVYVENFTELANNGVQVFARVRLDEYMELGTGAGVLNDDGTASINNKAKSIVDGAKLDDKNTWTPYIPFGGAEQNTDKAASDLFRTYWTLDTAGGSTVYMPTFNKNKDSLEADINGTSKDEFASYAKYEAGDLSSVKDSKVYAIYDADAAEDGQKEVDELAVAGISADTVIQRGPNALLDLKNWEQHIKVEQEVHTAKETLGSFIMSMEQYLAALEAKELNGNPFNGTGDFWVYDNDGWAYWANPIDPDTATGLLLNQIERTEQIINQDWYYAINVVAQFVTGDDLGRGDNTGFYDLSQGKAPSTDALTLLEAIGVDVGTEVDNAEDLAAELAKGGVVVLTDDIVLTGALTVSEDTLLNLNGHTISYNGNGLWNDDEDAKVWSLISVRGAGVILTISGGTDAEGNAGGITAKKDDSYCVDVREGAKVIINDGTYVGNISCVYVREGEAEINGGEFSIQQLCVDKSENKQEGYGEMLNCHDASYANGTAKITVNGGSFGNFNPSNVYEETAEGAAFVSYLAEGCTVSEEEGVYTVVEAEEPAEGETVEGNTAEV